MAHQRMRITLLRMRTSRPTRVSCKAFSLLRETRRWTDMVVHAKHAVHIREETTWTVDEEDNEDLEDDDESGSD